MIQMADYTEPDYVDRRVRYFDGQFLREQDFVDEQRYHVDRERRLARAAHTPGIVEGLAVTAVPNAAKVIIAPGTAMDGLGRLLVRVDPGDPLDLTELVDHEDDVAVVVGLTYAREEADAPQGGASPRWRENPQVVRFLDGAADAPPAETTLRLARVVLQHPDGTAVVDAEWVPPRSGLGVRGRLSVSGAATFAGDVSGNDGTDLRVSPGLRVTGPTAFDSTTRVDIVNGSNDYGRANLVLTGRYQDGNDGWNFGTAARNSVVFARTAVASGEGVGAVGDEQVSLQLEGNSRSLGVLTRDRGAEPALVVAQDGTVQVGTTDLPGAMEVVGDLIVHRGAAVDRVGRWTTEILRFGRQARLRVTIGAGSNSNVVVVRHGLPTLGLFDVVVPDGTAGQWFGRFTTFDPQLAVQGQTLTLGGGNPMLGDASQTNPNGAINPAVLVLELHRIADVG